jgi:hypothetical protein
VKPDVPDKVSPGDPITDGLLNGLAEAFERFLNLEVAPGSYLYMDKGPSGIALALLAPQEVMAKLSGATSPYSWAEVERPDPTLPWATISGGRTGTSDAYELNAKSGLADKVVGLRWTSAGDWRFQFVGVACRWTFDIRDCRNGVVNGATINFRQSGVLIATATTVSGGAAPSMPLGTYDVEVIPPASSFHDTYTGSHDHTVCGQTAITITLTIDANHVCTSVCHCFPMAVDLDITFSFSATYTGSGGVVWPNKTLTYALVGGNPAWLSPVFAHPTLAGRTVQYQVTCNGGTSKYDLDIYEPSAASYQTGNLLWSNTTCNPLHGSQGTLTGWTSLQALWNLLE